MQRFKTGILIRDNRLEIMQNAGLDVDYEVLSDADFILELKRKLAEEAGEILEAHSKKELTEELADVFEVIEHLIGASNISREEIEKIKQEKYHKIGGFSRKIKTHSVGIADTNLEELKYYANRPEKYPRVKD